MSRREQNSAETNTKNISPRFQRLELLDAKLKHGLSHSN